MLCIIFQLFQENDKKDEAEAEAALKKKADSDSEEEELDTQQKEKGISNKKKKVTLRHSNCFASFFFHVQFCGLACLHILYVHVEHVRCAILL